MRRTRTKRGALPRPRRQGTAARRCPHRRRSSRTFATIRELLELLARLRVNLTAHARDDLIDPLALLDAAANRRETDAKPVREALQRVLLTVGTGALATLSGPARRRLAALTGIALPGCETHTA